MAPGALVDLSADEVPIPVNTERDGKALESLSDDIDAVNILKNTYNNNSNNQNLSSSEKSLYDESEFDKDKDKTQFRQYESACERVKAFYHEQHTKQTVAYNLKARNRFHHHHRNATATTATTTAHSEDGRTAHENNAIKNNNSSASCSKRRMTVWQAIEKLNTLIDESDPDTSLSQIEHLLQSAEAIRRDGKPRWMQLTGLIHDLGKLLYFFDAEGQWDVVGDTFPVGCAYDERIVYGRDSFRANPDFGHEVYDRGTGIYENGIGLDNVMLSWGHDEYLYHVVKDQSTLPDEALAMIRYHSFYSWHTAGAYRELMNEKDWRMLKAVKAFNPYDLYSKSDELPKVEELKPYYEELIDEFFPQKVLDW